MKSLFIVDDDKVYIDFLMPALQRHFQVRAFYSGEDLLQVIDQQVPDIITIDYDMPGMNGQELFRILKEKCPDTHLIILSSNEDGQVVLDLINDGVRDYVIKDEHVIKGLLYAIEGNSDLYEDWEMNKS